MTNSIKSFVHDPTYTSSNEETFLQDFLELLDSLKLLENIEYMFPLYYMHSYMFNNNTNN